MEVPPHILNAQQVLREGEGEGEGEGGESVSEAEERLANWH